MLQVRKPVVSQPKRKRKISLLQARSINMTDMAGAGPFVTPGFVAGSLSGYTFLYVRVAGDVLCFLTHGVQRTGCRFSAGRRYVLFSIQFKYRAHETKSGGL